MLKFDDNAVQTLLRDHTINLFQRVVEAKFSPSNQTIEQLRERLLRLSLPDLEALFSEVVSFKTVQQLKAWVEGQASPSTVEVRKPVPHLERVKQRIETLQVENPTISPKNQQALTLLKAWCDEPDELGDAWWDEFETDLYQNRLNFPEREIL